MMLIVKMKKYPAKSFIKVNLLCNIYRNHVIICELILGENLPADLEVGSESNDNSDDSCNDQDNSEWNMMGAALEREFLGLN